MKIDPSPCVINLKDGTNYTLFESHQFLELVEEHMGYEASRWLRVHIEQAEKAADYTQSIIESDLNSYESELDSNRQAFHDIEYICRDMISDFNKEKGRNRLFALRPWRNKVEEILKVISNQI